MILPTYIRPNINMSAILLTPRSLTSSIRNLTQPCQPYVFSSTYTISGSVETLRRKSYDPRIHKERGKIEEGNTRAVDGILRCVHSSVYEKNEDEEGSHLSRVPEDAIQVESQKSCVTHLKTGVFGPAEKKSWAGGTIVILMRRVVNLFLSNRPGSAAWKMFRNSPAIDHQMVITESR